MTPNRKLFMTAAVRHSRPQVLSVFALDTYFVDVNESNKGFVHSGLVVLESKEYAWGLSTIPENVVLCLTQEGVSDQHVEVVFDASEVKKGTDGKFKQGRTISLETIKEAIYKARDELGWGTFNNANKVMFTGEMLMDRKERQAAVGEQ